MLENVCKEMNNYFITDIISGTYTITGGNIEPLRFMNSGQYFRITGSALNDGVYQYPTNGQLSNEIFTGEIWVMAVPKSVLRLAQDVSDFINKNETDKSAIVSETFGKYSQKKATNSDGTAVRWQQVFKDDLRRWRKI